MKIELVFIPSPGVGHIRSTTALAKLLVDNDDRLSVTLIVIPSQFSDHASSSVYTKSEDRLRYCLLSAVDQDPNQTYISYIESKKPCVRAAVSELATDVSTRSDSRLAGIVVDMFCTSMLDVADELNLPTYIVYTSNASYLGLQFHVQSLYEDNKLDVSELRDSDVKFDVPTLTRQFPANCLPSVMLTKKWFPYVLGRATSFRKTKGILVNSVAELEPKAVKFFSGGDGNTNIPPVYTVGPIMDFITNGEDEKRSEILRWLREQPTKSVVFLCFGSMGGFTDEQTRKIAVALERSGHRFLWSLRRASPVVEDMIGSPPGEVTNLEEVLPKGFLDRTVDTGKIISWAPQVAVLESPAIGAFVTHCGWNSILESLWFGVPMAAWPIFGEQQFNAFHMVVELGLAAEVKKEYRRDFLVGEPEIVTAEEIERGIKCAMEQHSKMRKMVTEMKDKLHVALLDGGSSNCALRKFVQDVVDNIP